MVNKKDLINKFINKIKILKKNKLINIYNNLLQYKKGGINIRARSHVRNPQPIFQQQPLIQYYPLQTQTKQPSVKIPPQKCYVINSDYTEDYIINKKKLLAPSKYDLNLNMQVSIDALRLYDVINYIITNFEKDNKKHKYICTNLKIFSTTDNFYIVKLLLFLENYLKKHNYKYTIDKKRKFIILNYSNEEYIIKYKYIIETNSIDVKIGKKQDTMSPTSRSRSNRQTVSQRSSNSSSSSNRQLVNEKSKSKSEENSKSKSSVGLDYRSSS
jgi:hypothetical protein